MRQVPDRMVTIVLIIAIIVAISGFVNVVNKVGGDFSLITGFATSGTGIVNVTVDATAAITLTNSTVEFGNGAVTGGAVGTIVNTSEWAGQPSTFANSAPITVQNDGNVDVNITINGTPVATFLNSNSQFQWAGATGEGGCPAANLTTTLTEMAAAAAYVCTNLTSLDSADHFNINIQVNLSSDLLAQTYTADVEIVAAQV